MFCQEGKTIWQSKKKDLLHARKAWLLHQADPFADWSEYLGVKDCFHRYLIFMAWALAILSQALQSLVDQHYILLIDVETQEAQATRRTSTNAVQKLKGLTNKVVICFVVLIPQEILKAKESIPEALKKKNHCANCFQFSPQECFSNSRGSPW